MKLLKVRKMCVRVGQIRKVKTVTPVNPLCAEMIAVGRATPKFAGNTFVPDGECGIRKNYSYDFRIFGGSSGLIEEKATTS